MAQVDLLKVDPLLVTDVLDYSLGINKGAQTLVAFDHGVQSLPQRGRIQSPAVFPKLLHGDSPEWELGGATQQIGLLQWCQRCFHQRLLWRQRLVKGGWIGGHCANLSDEIVEQPGDPGLRQCIQANVPVDQYAAINTDNLCIQRDLRSLGDDPVHGAKHAVNPFGKQLAAIQIQRCREHHWG